MELPVTLPKIKFPFLRLSDYLIIIILMMASIQKTSCVLKEWMDSCKRISSTKEILGLSMALISLEKVY